MYLHTVLKSIASPKKIFAAEDLYKLNEAIFNLQEEDTIDGKMSKKLFEAVERIKTAYATGRYDRGDPNFFYDYVALLSTMQNQHFFNEKQNKEMLQWLLEAVGGGAAPAKGAAGKGVDKDIARLEAENAALEKQMAKMMEVSAAIQTIKTFKPPEAGAPDAKAKAKAKAKGKAKAKAKGKAKAKKEEEEEGSKEE